MESTEMASLTSNYHFDHWNFSISALYRGDRGTNKANQDNLDSYWLNYTKIQYSRNDSLTWSLQASNLGDGVVNYPSQGGNVSGGIPSRGREVSLGLTWKLP